MQSRPLILYIEDDADDVEILSGAFEIVSPEFELINAINGEEGIAKLKQLVAEENYPRLIVLDINMPKMNGKEVVVSLKKDNLLKNIPVVILSTSRSKMDMLFFDKHRVTMMSKPMSFTDYLSLAKEMVLHCMKT
jgi:CheY-like chemotaxis protein